MEKTLGKTVAELRKAQGMTQLELAEKMAVTDKAVSKWERDLSCPDINSLPLLAQVLGVSVNDLLECRTAPAPAQTKIGSIAATVFKAVALAMGVAVTVLSALDALDVHSGMTLLGLGLSCAGLSLLSPKGE